LRNVLGKDNSWLKPSLQEWLETDGRGGFLIFHQLWHTYEKISRLASFWPGRIPVNGGLPCPKLKIRVQALTENGNYLLIYTPALPTRTGSGIFGPFSKEPFPRFRFQDWEGHTSKRNIYGQRHARGILHIQPY